MVKRPYDRNNPSAILEVCRILNQLKKRKIIQAWALIGSVAAMHYLEPMTTIDVDVSVLVESDNEWRNAVREIQKITGARWKGHQLAIDDILFDILPSSINPVYEDAVRGARAVRADNIRVRVASPEHLIVMGLIAFRPSKDFGRIIDLRRHADEEKLQGLLRKFDDENKSFAKKLAWLFREDYPG